MTNPRLEAMKRLAEERSSQIDDGSADTSDIFNKADDSAGETNPEYSEESQPLDIDNEAELTANIVAEEGDQENNPDISEEDHVLDDIPEDNLEDHQEIAAISEPEIDPRDERMAAMEAELANLRQNAGVPHTPAAAIPAPEEQVEEGPSLNDLRSEMARAAADADVELYEETSKQYEQRLRDDITSSVVETVQRQTLEQQVHAAATMFQTEYADIEGDKILSSVAQTKFVERVQRGEPPVDAAKAVGNELREYRNSYGAVKQPSNKAKVSDELSQRRNMKRQTLTDVPAASSVMPAETEKPEPTADDAIQKMRKARGQVR